MTMTINTGISAENRQAIVKGLEKFLADSYTLYLKTHNFHWNVTGPSFQNLHSLFEQQYIELANAVDKIAERIRALGFPAPGSYAQFSALKTIQEELSVPSAENMITQLVGDNETLARIARDLFPVVDNTDDEATVDLLTERMEIHEKAAWMLRSLLA